VTAGDFNQDGKPDIATANTNGTVSVLLGNGDGTFQPYVDYSFGVSGQSIVVADFDLDGKLDLAVADFEALTLAVLLGNGDGTFKSPLTTSTGSFPETLVTGDFNHDGKPDVAVTQAIYVSVYLGKGDGTFQRPANYSLNQSAYGLAVGDFDGDGNTDFAATVAGTGVSVLLGNGDGTFRVAASYPIDNVGGALEAADFRDTPAQSSKQPLDLGALSSGGVSPLRGLGSGGFLSTKATATSSFTWSIAALDSNGDGSPDLVVSNPISNTVSLLLNTSGAAFTAGSTPNPSKVGQPVTFNATVTASVPGTGSPTGTVSFKDGQTLLGSAPLIDGRASFVTSILTKGQHTISSHYSGDGQFNGRYGPTIRQQVN